MANIQHHSVTVYGRRDDLLSLKKYLKGMDEVIDLHKIESDLPQIYRDMIEKTGGFYSFDSSFEMISSGQAELYFSTKWAVAEPHIGMLSEKYKGLVFILRAGDDVLNSREIVIFHRGFVILTVNLDVDVLMDRGLTRKEAEKALAEDTDDLGKELEEAIEALKK